MKLMTHTSLFWVTMSMVLFFIIGISFYFVFKELENNRIDQELISEMEIVRNNPDFFMNPDHILTGYSDNLEWSFTSTPAHQNYEISDSIISSPSQPGDERARYIRFQTNYQDQQIIFTLYKSTSLSDALTERIILLFTLMALLFALGLYILNQHVFTHTWKGFYQSLTKVKSFKAGASPPEFNTEEIDEFNELNQELSKMTHRITEDFHNLKSFTSHVTHEFQTPLAVILSKAELLMQYEDLNEEQLTSIKSVHRYARQLSKMTQTMSFMFKIDHEHYVEKEDVDIAILTQQSLNQLDDLLELKKINVHSDQISAWKLSMNKELAQSLVSNLVRNAVIHSPEKGEISIFIEQGQMKISNSGKQALVLETLFNEFNKGQDSNGLGLGMAIIQKIADFSNFELSYSFADQEHIFTVSQITR